MGHRVLITGGASGFGAALARNYATRGDRVLVTDVHPSAPADLAAADPAAADLAAADLAAADLAAADPAAADPAAAAHGGETAYLTLDVRDQEAWSRARDWLVEHWGGLDLLVNNAGVAAGGRIDVIPVEDWQWIIDINLVGVVRGCRTFTPLLKDQGHGRIVNVASMAGLVHPPGMSSYNVVKAGVVALSETLLHELAGTGVGVSVVCPSFFRSNLDQSLSGSDPALEHSASALIGGARRDADTVAARTVAAVDKGRFLIRPDAEGRALHLLKRLAPPAYHAAMQVVGRRVARQARERDRARPPN